jgi:hypothetical protein
VSIAHIDEFHRHDVLAALRGNQREVDGILQPCRRDFSNLREAFDCVPFAALFVDFLGSDGGRVIGYEAFCHDVTE